MMRVKISDRQISSMFRSVKRKARNVVKDSKEVGRILEEANKKLDSIPDIRGKISYIPALFSLVGDYIKGNYRQVPVKTIIAIVGGLIYFVAPGDLIPDYIVGIGYLDDISVIEMCWRFVRSDIERYMEWRESAEREYSYY